MDIIQQHNVVVKGNLNAAETMIFSHGFGNDQSAWEKVAEPFLSDYKVVLYDLAGSGRTDMNTFSPDKYDTLYAYADDLVEICEVLNIENAIMVAHSVSGMISLLAFEKAPQLFSKMVFVGASPKYINVEGYVGGFTQEALDGLYNNMQTNYFAWVSGFAPYVMSNSDKPELAAYFAKTLSDIRPDISVSVARTIFQGDYRHKLDLLTIPTLLVHNDNDPAVPVSVGEYMKEHIPTSTLKIIHAEGHFPHISAPDEVIGAVQKFVA